MCPPYSKSGMETFVGCQRGSAASAIEEECRVVAYESCGRASSSAAANPIKPEPSDEACDPEIRRGPRGLDPHTDDRTLPEEGDGMDEGTASRKRGAPSTSDGSGRKQAKCEHGRQRSKCTDCGGSGICPHGREKRQCKACGGSAICAHGRIKSTCKECGGSRICPHGRQKPHCKECGGSAICPHGKDKYTCKECGGSAICPHGRDKRQCKECGGSKICAHGRQKQRCKECGGSAICAHGRIKYTCKDCGGSAICPHGREKPRCKECGGSAICPHGRNKYTCKDCPHVRRSTSEAQGSQAVCSTSGDAAYRGDALDRDALLDELRAWVGGLERIGDAEQVVALLVQSEVSLANLGSFTVDELAATGIGEAAACELLSQFECRGGMRR